MWLRVNDKIIEVASNEKIDDGLWYEGVIPDDFLDTVGLQKYIWDAGIVLNPDFEP